MLFLLGLVLSAAAAPGLDGGTAPSNIAATAATPGAATAGPDGGTPEDDAKLQLELEKALGKDKTGAQGGSQPGPAAATSDSPPPAPANLARGSQSLNPDISAIVDLDFGYQRRQLSFLAGDDPDLKSATGRKAIGPLVQEVELALSAIVDPYFKGEVYLTIPNLSGLEVEEAFATTTSLPANLQVKMGSFRSAFGRQNGQHLHVQDFTRRPLINAAFLGADGLRGAAAQVSWLVPLPFYLTVFGEVRRPSTPDQPVPVGADEQAIPPPVSTFGGGTASDLSYVGAAKAFAELSDDWSVYGGLNVAKGISPGIFIPASTGTYALGANRGTVLLGGDLYVKWKPANVSGGYHSLAWQTEAIFRHFSDGDGLPGEWDGGLYSQIVAQVSRRWFVGVRGDLLGLPTSSVLARTAREAISLTFQPSEFARVRAYLEAEQANLAAGSGPVPAGQLIPTLTPGTAVAAFLQLEISIGAHGAHAF